jgi:phospholipid/cholesterol/gamma-HCH transport system substrate-binding protein
MSLKISNEAKTGLFVIVCLAALAGLLIKVGNFNFFKHGYVVKSHFHFTGGVKKNAPVRLSGVDVGEVKGIRVLYGDDTLVEVDLWLEEGTQIRLDSRAYVTTLGLMGEKYIEIKPGTPAVPYAKEGDLIVGDDPVRLEELIEMGTKVANDISAMAKDISKVTNHVDDAIQSNRPKIDSIFDNLEETSENFNDFSQDIKHHPWKILIKGKEKTKDEMDKERLKKRQRVKPGLPDAASAELPHAKARNNQNFGPDKK